MDRRGEPGIDMLGAIAALWPYTEALHRRQNETYRNVFTVHYPDEERHDARPAGQPHLQLSAMGAVGAALRLGR